VVPREGGDAPSGTFTNVYNELVEYVDVMEQQYIYLFQHSLASTVPLVQLIFPEVRIHISIRPEHFARQSLSVFIYARVDL